MPTVDATTALRGASLRVTRQRAAVLAALAGSPHADADTIATTINTMATKRILIVDDETNVLFTLKLVLEEDGYEITTASSCAA